jgi:hypothetical protein
LRLTFGHLLRIVAQGVELGGDGLHGGECVISVALLSDELAVHFRRAQTGIEPVGTELGVGLTLAIDNGSDIRQQVRKMGFHTLTTACRKGIEAGEPAL